MSGICDTCKREPCNMRFDGCKTCDVYEGGETRWQQLFGTPERAARTLAGACRGCYFCVLLDVDGRDCSGKCLISDYDALFEWLRGEGE